MKYTEKLNQSKAEILGTIKDINQLIEFAISLGISCSSDSFRGVYDVKMTYLNTNLKQTIDFKTDFDISDLDMSVFAFLCGVAISVGR